LLRGFQVLAKSVPAGEKFRNTPSACGGDRHFEDFASLLKEDLAAGRNRLIEWIIRKKLLKSKDWLSRIVKSTISICY